MGEKTLSIFVDESGNFGYPDKVSRYYVIGLVLHDQDALIQTAVDDLDLALRDMQISHHCFHAGPMIRREKGYEFMDAVFRRRQVRRREGRDARGPCVFASDVITGARKGRCVRVRRGCARSGRESAHEGRQAGSRVLSVLAQPHRIHFDFPMIVGTKNNVTGETAPVSFTR